MGASWLEALDTPYDVDVTSGNAHVRLRVAVLNTGAAVGVTGYRWQYRKGAGTWTNITATSSDVKTFTSAWFTDGDDIPQLLTASTYQSDNNAAESATGVLTLTAGLAVDTEFESEIALEVVAADVADSDSLTFRLVQSDETPFGTYTETPTFTITKTAVPGVRYVAILR